MYDYNAIAKGTRDAARFLSMNGPLDPSDPDSATLISEAQCIVVHGNADCTGPSRLTGLTTTMVTICDSATCTETHSAQPTGSSVVNLVTVTVTGVAFSPLVPCIMPSPLTFADISTTMRQVL